MKKDLVINSIEWHENKLKKLKKKHLDLNVKFLEALRKTKELDADIKKYEFQIKSAKEVKKMAFDRNMYKSTSKDSTK